MAELDATISRAAARGTSDRARQTITALPMPPQQHSVLVILCGLMRYWKLGLGGMRRHVFDPNPNTTFGLALLTSRWIVCTDSDRKNGECPCFGKLPNNLTDAVANELPRRVKIVHTDFGSALRKGLKQGEQWSYRLATSHAAIEAYGLVAKYDHLLVLRPDVYLTKPLLVSRACSAFASLVIISGTRQRMMHFHDRDWDWALLACEPRALHIWLRPHLTSSVACQPGELPGLPPDFRGVWNAKAIKPGIDGIGWHECAALRDLTQEHLNVSNLDAQGIFSRLLVARLTALPQVAFGKLRPQGCLRAVNFSSS